MIAATSATILKTDDASLAAHVRVDLLSTLGNESASSEPPTQLLAASALPVAALPLKAHAGRADAAAWALEATRPLLGGRRSQAKILDAAQTQELPHLQPWVELDTAHRRGASPW